MSYLLSGTSSVNKTVGVFLLHSGSESSECTVRVILFIQVSKLMVEPGIKTTWWLLKVLKVPCLFPQNSPSNSRGNEGVRLGSRFIPPLSGLRSPDSLELIYSHLLHCPHYLRWSAEPHRPHGPDAEGLRLQRAWMSTCWDLLSHTNVAHKSPGPWLWQRKSLWMGELIQNMIEILSCGQVIHCGGCTSPSLWRGLKRL